MAKMTGKAAANAFGVSSMAANGVMEENLGE